MHASRIKFYSFCVLKGNSRYVAKIRFSFSPIKDLLFLQDRQKVPICTVASSCFFGRLHTLLLVDESPLGQKMQWGISSRRLAPFYNVQVATNISWMPPWNELLLLLRSWHKLFALCSEMNKPVAALFNKASLLCCATTVAVERSSDPLSLDKGSLEVFSFGKMWCQPCIFLLLENTKKNRT